MRLWCCPDLTRYSTNCDVHLSWIAGTQWIAFLTFIIILRTDRSLLSALDSCLGFLLLLCIPFPWPFSCPIISAEMARYKGDWEDKAEQGWCQHHVLKADQLVEHRQNQTSWKPHKRNRRRVEEQAPAYSTYFYRQRIIWTDFADFANSDDFADLANSADSIDSELQNFPTKFYPKKNA